MAVIVRHKESQGEYILLGAGFGAYKGIRPSMILGNLAPHEDAGEIPVALVCDAQGAVLWVRSENLTVLSVDGQLPAQVLAGQG